MSQLCYWTRTLNKYSESELNNPTFMHEPNMLKTLTRKPPYGQIILDAIHFINDHPRMKVCVKFGADTKIKIVKDIC